MADLLRRARLMAAGALALAIGLSGLALGSRTELLAVVIGLGFVFQGIGYGLLRPPISTALANTVEDADLGAPPVALENRRRLGRDRIDLGPFCLVQRVDRDDEL